MRLLDKAATLLGGLTVASAALTMTGGPASAAGLVIAPDVSPPSAAPYSVTPKCVAGVGVSTNLNQFTYPIEASADAASTNTGVYATGTGVTCYVYRTTYPYTRYGAATGGLPGPHAEGANLVTVPTSVDVALVREGQRGVQHQRDRSEGHLPVLLGRRLCPRPAPDPVGGRILFVTG